MTQNINVPLSDRVFRQLKRWAESRQQDLGDAIADYLLENPPSDEDRIVPPATSDPQLEREKSAYLRLYPQLKEQYMGKYVAIYKGELVDHDDDYGTLFERVDDHYPDTFVWLTRVQDEPIGTLNFRSPRFLEDVS